MTREEFVKKYYPSVAEIARDTNIFPQVMMAQSIIESSGKVNGVWQPGQSLLARNANNYFGIKADPSWKGSTITLNTGEYLNGQYVTVSGKFRKYASVQDSFKDYIAFLKKNPRYTNAGVFTAPSPLIQAQRLQQAGYATDPGYANLINGVINSISKYIPKLSSIASGGVGLTIAAIAIFFF